MAQTEVARPATRTFGLSALVNAITSTGDLQLAYSAFRMTLGMNIFFHGAMRPNLPRKSFAWLLRQYRPDVSGKAAKRSRGSRAHANLCRACERRLI